MIATILNLLSCSVYWIQVPTKKFLGCNQHFLTAKHYVDESEITGKSIDTVFSGEYLKLINELLDKASNTEKKSVMYFDNLADSRKLLLIHLSYSSAESIAIFSETSIDEKRLDKALWEEKEKLFSYINNIVEYVPASLYWKDKNSIILGGSQLHAEIAGFHDRKEVIGKTDYEFVWKEQAERIIENDQFVMKNNKTIIFEETAKLRDGNIHTFLTKKSPLRGSLGETIGILGVSLDITELKETQLKLQASLKKAEAANQAKTEFLENMRHDIRTPLSGIVGCAQLIQMQVDNPKIIENVKDLVQSSNALLEFLNKILESIQVASGEIPLLKKRFDLYQILYQVICLNKPQANIKHLNLQLNYDETIPTYLLGDFVRIQRIILELVTNALKFTDSGEIIVTARLMSKKTRTGKVIIKLSVSDTGMGIPYDKQHEVYTRFTRLTPSYIGIYSGAGLGLSVVKQFIDDLGGEIQLNSQPGQGATFMCLIPLEKVLSTTDESKMKEVSSKVERTDLQKIPGTLETRVLVVEDNPIAAKVAQGVLLKLNCQTDVAPDGKIALSHIEKKHYDLILLDVGLPDNDGCEVARRIRLKQWQQNPPVPIIGLTAHIALENKRSCLMNGMNAIYTKPLTAEKASEILNAFLSHSQDATLRENQDKPSQSLQSLPLLDKGSALKLLGSKETFHELLILLASGLTREIRDLKRYYKEGNLLAIQTLMHKWKGGASYCAASRLEQVCQEIEMVLQAKSLKEEAEALYQQLLQIATDTKEAAEEEFRR
jgi:two-component system, OmpR family, aerobic respiration control sensor histidine kinase ArcB